MSDIRQAAPEAAFDIEWIPAEEIDAGEGWTISDDSAAEWALQKIAQERAELARLEALAQEQQERIQQQVDAARRRCESATGWLTGRLADYFERVPHKTTKTQETYRLLSGRLVLKHRPPKATYDDTKLVEWLKANGYTNLVQTKESPRWGDLKKGLDMSGGAAVMAATGEIVDCIVVEPSPDTFQVETEAR